MAAPTAAPPRVPQTEVPTPFSEPSVYTPPPPVMWEPISAPWLWGNPYRLWKWLRGLADARGQLETADELERIGKCRAQTMDKCNELARHLNVRVNWWPYRSWRVGAMCSTAGHFVAGCIWNLSLGRLLNKYVAF